MAIGIDSTDSNAVTNEQKIECFRRMWLIRAFEEQARELFMRNVIHGTTHMYIGQEAVAVGVCSVLEKSDYVTSTHRGHGHCLAKGGDPKAMMAEVLGKATGYCKGKGGSMHIADFDLGILGANGIVGGGIGIAAGAAYASKYRGDGRVTACFFGDGAINQGVFFEICNMAALWKLPLVFVCERNQFAEFTYANHTFADPDLTKRSVPFGFSGTQVDGNDVLAVRAASAEAVARARRGDGPSLVIANTFRMEGHFIGDPMNYRDPEEVASWRARDPLILFVRHLLANGVLTEEQIATFEEEARQICADATDHARSSPAPELSTLHEDVYA